MNRINSHLSVQGKSTILGSVGGRKEERRSRSVLSSGDVVYVDRISSR